MCWFYFVACAQKLKLSRREKNYKLDGVACTSELRGKIDIAITGCELTLRALNMLKRTGGTKLDIVRIKKVIEEGQVTVKSYTALVEVADKMLGETKIKKGKSSASSTASAASTPAKKPRKTG